MTWVLFAVIAACYFYGLTPGHVFVQDDFAAYVMQAENLVEGDLYTDIRYMPKPQAPWVSSVNGYPPVYPLLLAPLYWLRGLDRLAMKAVTVSTFVIFLVAFAVWVRPLLSARLRVLAVKRPRPGFVGISLPDDVFSGAAGDESGGSYR